MSSGRSLAILFDLDGVLARRTNFIPIWDRFSHEYGIPVAETKMALQRFDGDYLKGRITNEEFWTGITSELRIKCDIPTLNQMFFSPKISNIRLLEGLSYLRQRAYICMISNNPRSVLEEAEVAYGEHFDNFFFSCDTGYTKPSEEPFRIASERLGVSLDRFLFVDDDKKNLGMVESLGIECIHFKWTEPDTTCDLVDRLRTWVSKW